MSKFKFLLLTFTLSISSAYSGHETHGGDAIVCWLKEGDKVKIGHLETNKWNVHKVIKSHEGVITVNSYDKRFIKYFFYGKLHNSILRNLSDISDDFEGDLIKSVETVEYYKLKQLKHKNTDLINQLKKLDFDDAHKELHNLFKAVPWFYHKLQKSKNLLTGIGKISENAIPAKHGLEDVDDGGLKLTLPNNCKQVQAAVREMDQVFLSESIFRNMGQHDSVGWTNSSTWKIDGKGFQQALLQLHEELYFIGTEFYDHKTSTPTQNLIIKMLSIKDLKKEDIEILLDKYDFK